MGGKGQRKLTLTEQTQIAKLYQSGVQTKVLAREFNVCHMTIHQVLKDFQIPRRHQVLRAKPNKTALSSMNPKIIPISKIEQSHLENLEWAMDAAGHFLRCNEEPKCAPNNAAYYLYQMALKEPKDFFNRFNQTFKGGEDEEQKDTKRASKRSIEEITMMLEALAEPTGGP